ncbi:MAG: hypothetical protein H6Q58_2302 [Firmicutes bacterium]|nr:hypothetical protein [Bacillota bacterium]
MFYIKQRIIINAPLEKINAWTEPKRWSQWRVNYVGPNEIEGDGGIGTVIDGILYIMGVPYQVREKIVEYTKTEETVYLRTSAGENETGSAITLSVKANGTEVTTESVKRLDDIDPSRRPLVEKIFANNMRCSLENLKIICENI